MTIVPTKFHWDILKMSEFWPSLTTIAAITITTRGTVQGHSGSIPFISLWQEDRE